jgi:hypothetical protein
MRTHEPAKPPPDSGRAAVQRAARPSPVPSSQISPQDALPAPVHLAPPGRSHSLASVSILPPGGSGDVPTTQIRAAAQAGLRTPGRSLPYAPQIQAAFGRHDISGVQAHTDPAAQAAAASAHAVAFAAGEHVVFGVPPDLRTAAHEAAHVVQQRAGVQVPGGIGQVGDAYEQEADAIASRVASGQSAEALLNRRAGSPGGLVEAQAGRASQLRQITGQATAARSPVAAPMRSIQRMVGTDGSKILTLQDLNAYLLKAGLPAIDLNNPLHVEQLGLPPQPAAAPAPLHSPKDVRPGAALQVLEKEEKPQIALNPAMLDAAIAQSAYHFPPDVDREGLTMQEVFQALRVARTGQMPKPAAPKVGPARLGVELETGGITMLPPDPEALAADKVKKELIKGATIVLDGNVPVSGKHWAATVELAGRGFRLEVIIRGEEGRGVPIAGNFPEQLTQIGAEIVAATDSLKSGGKFTIVISPDVRAKVSRQHAIPPQKVDQIATALEKETWAFADIGQSHKYKSFGLQVTVPMPLRALASYTLPKGGFRTLHDRGTAPVEDEEGKPDKGEKFVRVTRNHLPPRLLADLPAPALNPLLGFLGTIFSYTVNSTTVGRGLKHASPVMPRTDFVGMKHVLLAQLGSWLPETARREGRSPLAVFKSLVTETYGTVTGKAWSSEEVYWEEKSLKMNDWLNLLLVEDRDRIAEIDEEARHGQIGGLGQRFEQVGGELAPIMEFRDAGSVFLADIPSKLKQIAAEILALHAIK